MKTPQDIINNAISVMYAYGEVVVNNTKLTYHTGYETIKELEALRDILKDYKHVPEGYVVVPEIPTKEMASVDTWDFNRFYPATEIYKEMLARRPK